MRAAPAVSVNGTGGLPWRLIRTLPPAAATGAVCTWLLQHLQWTPAAVAWLTLGLASLAAGLAWRRARPVAASLVFDGQRWTCDGVETEVEVMLDLDRFLLVRCTPVTAGARRWLAYTAAELHGAFHGLRVALYAPRQPAQA